MKGFRFVDSGFIRKVNEINLRIHQAKRAAMIAMAVAEILILLAVLS